MFFKKTVDSILSDLTRKISELQILAHSEREQAQVERAIAEAREAEAARADGVVDRLTALIS